MSPEDRRPFRGAPFDRGRDRHPGPAPDRGDRPPADRAFAPPRPFVRSPTRGGDMPPPEHAVHLRDGDREMEVSGNPAFVRQVLDDLPVLMARLRGEAPGRSTTSMPPPPSIQPAMATPVPAAPEPEGSGNGPAAGPGNGTRPRRGATSLEDRVLEVLRTSARPLPIAAIRQRLDDEVTGQQVRRLLEKAGRRVTMSADRPATYSLS